MLCPFCGGQSRVYYGRNKTDRHYHRRRECLTCKREFSTVEKHLPEWECSTGGTISQSETETGSSCLGELHSSTDS